MERLVDDHIELVQRNLRTSWKLFKLSGAAKTALRDIQSDVSQVQGIVEVERGTGGSIC